MTNNLKTLFYGLVSFILMASASYTITLNLQKDLLHGMAILFIIVAVFCYYQALKLDTLRSTKPFLANGKAWGFLFITLVVPFFTVHFIFI